LPGPKGQHGWRGGRGLQRGQIARFIEPCLLSLLQDANRHGYELMANLSRFGLDPETIDSGLVYRALRDMEMAGWVVSQWGASESGPARRTYTLTALGKEALGAWMEELKRTHEIIHKLLLTDSEDGVAH
jgi:PadR family transcriptional regulator, regulatory protein PadR